MMVVEASKFEEYVRAMSKEVTLSLMLVTLPEYCQGDVVLYPIPCKACTLDMHSKSQAEAKDNSTATTLTYNLSHTVCEVVQRYGLYEARTIQGSLK
ncbi:hypothetical protein JTB14_012424 [Gonioctena quinquepunctata]|nr:hypothetical protein JTB14_012424 [Gonioctena quinquepunctata]